jgi:hypothetical protein
MPMPPIRTHSEFLRLRALDDLHRAVALEVHPVSIATACDVPSGVLSAALLRYELDREDDEAEKAA